jgi:small subunit ribosomal protein S9
MQHAHIQKSRAVGRRKTAVARAILTPGSGKVLVNKKPLEQYFPIETLRAEALRPFVATENAGKYDVHVNVEALLDMSEDNRIGLRKEGLLTRDPRMVERKKYGQKKARKRFQFSKR